MGCCTERLKSSNLHIKQENITKMPHRCNQRDGLETVASFTVFALILFILYSRSSLSRLRANRQQWTSILYTISLAIAGVLEPFNHYLMSSPEYKISIWALCKKKKKNPQNKTPKHVRKWIWWICRGVSYYNLSVRNMSTSTVLFTVKSVDGWPRWLFFQALSITFI